MIVNRRAGVGISLVRDEIAPLPPKPGVASAWRDRNDCLWLTTPPTAPWTLLIAVLDVLREVWADALDRKQAA